MLLLDLLLELLLELLVVQPDVLLLLILLLMGFFRKKVSASAPPIWQSAGTRSDRRSLVCPAAVISGRWARRYDRCSVRGRPGAEAEAGAE